MSSPPLRRTSAQPSPQPPTSFKLAFFSLSGHFGLSQPLRASVAPTRHQHGTAKRSDLPDFLYFGTTLIKRAQYAQRDSRWRRGRQRTAPLQEGWGYPGLYDNNNYSMNTSPLRTCSLDILALVHYAILIATCQYCS